ncbi:MAG: Hint domain-containing protein [Rhodobacteraceae bacterium]|nr:Hint domain-containing protein [Paracoccaceae bacterium]
MKLAFFEVFGDSDRDGQITVTREGKANLLFSDDALLNRPVGEKITCTINGCRHFLAESEGETIVFEGAVDPDTRHQRIVKFALMQTADNTAGSDRIVLVSGHLSRGEAILDITRIKQPSTLQGDTMICFTPGCRILTAFGEIPVENIKQGDLVHTADNGLQPVRWIGRRELSSARLYAAPHLRPVKISKDAFGPGLPARDIRVSPAHRFITEVPNSNLFVAPEEVLISASGLIDGVRVAEDTAVKDVAYLHLLFDEHQIIYAEQTPTESFFPCPKSLMSLEESAQKEMFSALPDLENHPLNYGANTRPSLGATEAQLLRAA